MNSNSGGYDISSLTRHRVPSGNPALGHHLSHASAFGPHSGQQHLPSQPTLHHPGQHHPLLIPNLGLGNSVMSSNSSVIHPSHHQSLAGHPGHLQAAPHHHLPSHFNHPVLHQQMPHSMTASPSALHASQGTSHLSHHQPHLMSHPNQGVHQPTPVVPPPPAPSPAPTSIIPVVSDATNALASNVNLSSVQSLVDVLVELPLPSEAPEVGVKKQKLLPDEQQGFLSSLMMDQNNLLIISQRLSSCLQNAKNQLTQMNPSFIDRIKDSNNSNNSVSQSLLHQKNSYLLSLLNHLEVFRPNAVLPASSVTTGPQTRHQQQQQQQQQYWNPWTEQQNQQPTPSQSSTQTQVQSPYVVSPASHPTSYPSSRQTANQSTQNQTTNSLYSNNNNDNNSNSSSSFTDPSTPTPLMTPSSVTNDASGHQRYQQIQSQGHQIHSVQQPLHQQPGNNQYHNNNDQSLVDPVVDVNHYQTAEPVVMLDKEDPLLEQALADYYAKNSNGPDENA